MTEEEYFRKNYPDSCYGDKPLSPHWDFFQDGVEFGERQSEKKIAELEKENAELKADNAEWEKASDKWKNLYELTNQQLEMSNKVYNDNLDYSHHIEGQLTKVKEIIKNLLVYVPVDLKEYEEAEQFLKDSQQEE